MAESVFIPAFPVNGPNGDHLGMELWEYFASHAPEMLPKMKEDALAMCMNKAIETGKTDDWQRLYLRCVAKWNARYADEMLAERNRRQSATQAVQLSPDQPQYKFEVGQKVRVINGCSEGRFIGARLTDEVGPIYSLASSPSNNTGCYIWREDELEPIVEANL